VRRGRREDVDHPAGRLGGADGDRAGEPGGTALHEVGLQVGTGSLVGEPHLTSARPGGQPFDYRPGRHPAVEVAARLLAQRRAALDIAYVIHDLEGEGELVGVPHQGAQPIVVDVACRAAVGAGQPEQGARLGRDHEFVMPTQGGVVDSGRQGLDELAEGDVREPIAIGDAWDLTELGENRRVVGQHAREHL
jgi:hypothetical protein